MGISHRKPVRLVLVGGFLGAGKTSLILAAARLLRDRGARVALIANDQGGELVDTRLMARGGFDAGEVTGGCFCCKFSDFVDSAETLLASQPDVIFAEPVGSCMDIAATILRPLKRLCSDRFLLAPYTVLVDPARANDLLGPDADADLAYLFSKQIHEADLVYFTKADLGMMPPQIEGGVAGALSALTGEGVAGWVDLILSSGASAGSRQLEVDYVRYGEAEAALGWVNWQVRLDLVEARSPALIVGPFLDELHERLNATGAAIAHLKVLDDCDEGWIRASVCRNGDEPAVEGDLSASPAVHHELVVNLRAKASPESLDRMVETGVTALPPRVKILQRQAFRPGQPKPEHRDLSDS